MTTTSHEPRAVRSAMAAVTCRTSVAESSEMCAVPTSTTV